MKTNTERRELRVGFVPLADCAPLVMAQELGLFRKYGLNVVLRRELGWATVRDKIIHGELDAAHALAAMPVAATLGWGSVPCDCLTALVLNLNGNAITLSEQLWKNGVRDAATLREEMVRARPHKTFTFGVVSLVSSHNYLLRNWLAAARIHPDRDVRIVVVPPPQMAINLKAEHLDGFCVGEPWNSVAVQARAGWCVATSAELEPRHPEKVLMVRQEFAQRRAAEHLALVAALMESCEFCDAPENQEQLISTLARPQYVNAPPAALRRGFGGRFDFGHGNLRPVPEFHIFHRGHANEPSDEKAAWVLERIRGGQSFPKPARLDFALARRMFRPDLYEQALQLRSHSSASKNEFQNDYELTVLD